MLDTSPLDRHERIALSFSGGKDSLAVVYLLREHLDRVTVYHVDTGDLLPEQMEVVQHVRDFAPNFVTIQTDSYGWTQEHGLPTDLLPYGAHFLGYAMGHCGLRLVTRYDCCYRNLMEPAFLRMKADDITLVIRGTKEIDTPRMATRSGQVLEGLEFWYPLQAWSHDDVFAYLREQGAPISRVYDHVTNSPECARCSAWWNEGRAAYLKRFYPELGREYAERLRAIAAEVLPSVEQMAQEMGDADG